MIKYFLLALGVLVIFGSVFYMAAGAAGQPALMDGEYTIVPAFAATVSLATEVADLENQPMQRKIKATETSLLPLAVKTVGKPVRLTIPKINVNAKIESLGLTPQGAVAAPEGPREVSWYNLGTKPGEAGSALISGHSGIWRNTTTSVFDNLKKLQPGDTVSVTDDQGIARQFEVKELRVYSKDDSVPELFTKTGGPNLNIITCYGTWLPSEKTYDKRLVVFTHLKK